MLTPLWISPDRDIDDRPVAYFLIGPPGSGKTIWRNNHLKTSNRLTFVVSVDDIIERKMLYSGHDYPTALKMTDHDALEAMLSGELQAAVRRGKDVMIDMTNMTVKARSKWHNILTNNYRRVAVVFSVRIDDLLDRLKQRCADTGKDTSDALVRKMLADYQPPTSAEFESVLIA